MDAAVPPSTVFLVGQNPVVRSLAAALRVLAPVRASLVLAGEAGTGKRALATLVHRAGPTPADPCVLRPLTDLSDRQAFDALYGAGEGSLARGWRGTLYLEGIETLSFAMQARLAATLASPAFREVTVVTGTRASLASAARLGRVLPALMHRLGPIELAIPPLRDRRSDVAEIVRTWLEWLARSGSPVDRGALDGPVMARLEHHDWPGNTRELLRTVEVLVTALPSSAITPGAVKALLGASRVRPRGSDVVPLRDVERQYVLAALHACQGNQSLAARRLGIGRNTLIRLVRAMTLERVRAA